MPGAAGRFGISSTGGSAGAVAAAGLQTFDDVAAGIDRLGGLDEPLDLARVVAVGHSAGGHLAFWAAARRGQSAGSPGAEPRVRVAGAVAQAGVLDLREAARLRLSRDVVRTLLGGPPGKVPKRYDAASPIERLPLGVPQLLVHGEADDVVPIAIARRYAERASEAGDPAGSWRSPASATWSISTPPRPPGGP